MRSASPLSTSASASRPSWRACTARRSATNQSCAGWRSCAASGAIASTSVAARGDVAELQPPCRAVLVRLDGPLDVSGLQRRIDQLTGQLHLALRVVGRMMGGDVAVQGVGERRLVAEPARARRAPLR